MKYHRHLDFFLILALFLFLATGCASTADKNKALETSVEKIIEKSIDRPAEVETGFAIMQGFTNSTQTTLAILVPKDEKLVYFLVAPDNSKRALKANVFARNFSTWQIDQVHITDLKPETPYTLLVLDVRGNLKDQREFKTLDLRKDNPRFIAASCMDDSYDEDQRKAWSKIGERHADLILMIGDNVYADKVAANDVVAPSELIWKRYVETRNKLAIFRWRNLTPVLATWDDHDYGSNDSDHRFPFRAESAAVFMAFFPRPAEASEWQSGPGVSGAFKAYGQQFLFLDNRSFRTPNNHLQDDQTHFGQEQNDWLFQQMRQGKVPTWLISGDQFFGGYHKFESFEGSHSREFPKFTQRLKDVRLPFVMLSGDRRMSEIMTVSKREVGLKTYELTASGLHAETYPQALARNPNSRRLVGVAGPLNFMEIEPKLNNQGWQIRVRAWDVNAGALFDQSLKIKK